MKQKRWTKKKVKEEEQARYEKEKIQTHWDTFAKIIKRKKDKLALKGILWTGHKLNSGRGKCSRDWISCPGERVHICQDVASMRHQCYIFFFFMPISYFFPHQFYTFYPFPHLFYTHLPRLCQHAALSFYFYPFLPILYFLLFFVKFYTVFFFSKDINTFEEKSHQFTFTLSSSILYMHTS